jgi:hypothetical protein
VDERERRLGLNEAFFREVNERLEEMAESLDSRAARHDFICECSDASCAERISLTLDEYRRVRSKPATFAVKPGHEVADVEHVVLEDPRYVIVEKENEAAEVAAETDPRSR